MKSSKIIIMVVFLFLALFMFGQIIMGEDEASAVISVTVIPSDPPVIVSYYPLENISITEEESAMFNVSFTDNGDNIFVVWMIDDDIVQEGDISIPGEDTVGGSNYIFVADYASAGQYVVTVIVSDGGSSVSRGWIMNVTNVNRPPYFNSTIPDMQWYRGSTHTMDSLNNYATDPDIWIDDWIEFEVFSPVPSNIRAEIDPITNEVSFIARPGFVGSEVIYFNVTDSLGASNSSNDVTLTVLVIPPGRVETPSSGGGGRGGGRRYDELCENYWYCGSWFPCDPITSTRERECIDLAGCPVARNRPEEKESCIYIPTCYDNIKNGGELDVDCGGECVSCWECSDGIKNQGEAGIDCGGPCMACPTCDDGKINCQRLDKEIVLCEEDVDCGGPCKACELPAPVKGMGVIFYLIIAMIVTALIVTSVLILRKKNEEQEIIDEDLVLKDLRSIYEGIMKLEKTIGATSSNKIIKRLLYFTAKIIYHIFDIDMSSTEEELLKKLSKIKKEGAIKNSLSAIYSKLYYLKYSGQDMSKKELLQRIRGVGLIDYKIINKLQAEQEKRKQKLAKQEKARKKRKIKKVKQKTIPITLALLTIAMVFSLFVVPQQQIAKSGFSISQGEGFVEVDEVEGSLLSRFTDWLIESVRTVGKAEAIPPYFVYPLSGQILESLEDENASFLIQADDLDKGYPLEFSFVAEEVNNKFILQTIDSTIPMHNETAGWINFTPTENYAYDSNKDESYYKVTLVVKDSWGNPATIAVILNVTNVNDAPNITTYSPTDLLTTTVDENKSLLFSFNNNTADPDLIHPGKDSITYEWYLDSILNNTNESWNYNPNFCDAGMHQVVLEVTDSYTLTDSLTWEVEVLDVARPPILNKTFVGLDSYIEWSEEGVEFRDIVLRQFFEDSVALECSLTTELTYGYETVSVDSQVDVDGIGMDILINPDTGIDFVPSSDWFGVQKIKYFANNSALGYSNITITLNVTNIPDEPILDWIPHQYLSVNDRYIHTVGADDADNDILKFSDNTSLFNIELLTGVINFTPTSGQRGNYSVNISVTDGMFTDYQIVNFTVKVDNEPPNITAIYPYGTPLSDVNVYAFSNTELFPDRVTSINATENTTMIFNHTSFDLEGDKRVCKWYVDGVLKSNEDCDDIPYWNYSIDFSQDGIRNITLIVEDRPNNNDKFTWNISVKDVNRNPLFGKKIIDDHDDFNGGSLNQTYITSEPGNIILKEISPNVYYGNGTYVSPVIDLKGHYARTKIKRINWQEVRLDGTNITFRVRVSNRSNTMLSANWSEPYYNGSEDNLINSNGRYVQFKVNMSTEDNLITPRVEKIVINYEIKDMNITGNYVSWIDLNNFFDDKDGTTTLDYQYEDIFGSSILDLTIDTDGTVGLHPTFSGRAIFRFSANDSYSKVYSNNITLDVKLTEVPIVQPIVTSSSGGGGGSSQRKPRIIPVPEISYQQLIYAEALQSLPNRTVVVPIVLRNTGEETLNEISLSAETDLNNVSFKFDRDYIASIISGQTIRTKLYIQPGNVVNASYSVDVIAKVGEPELEDIYTLSINPSNVSEKLNLVRDLLQLHPVCRELEESVIKAQEALNNNQYDEANRLLEDIVAGCKYLVRASDQPAPKLPFILRNKWIFISIGIIIMLLLLAYFVPIIINKIKRPPMDEYADFRHPPSSVEKVEPQERVEQSVERTRPQYPPGSVERVEPREGFQQTSSSSEQRPPEDFEY